MPIGEWVLEQALRHVGRWRQSRPGVTISVNLSARQLEDPGLVAPAGRRRSGPAAPTPASLCLEVTEDTVEHNPELTARMLGALRQIGVELAIDDFGIGHSSLSQPAATCRSTIAQAPRELRLHAWAARPARRRWWRRWSSSATRSG